jgi:hypothetical protein
MIKTAVLLMITTLLLSCSRQEEPPALVLHYSGIEEDYRQVKLTIEPFCGRLLYSISTPAVLISIVRDSVLKDSTPAGITYWGKWTDNIEVSARGDRMYFKGSICYGSIKI